MIDGEHKRSFVTGETNCNITADSESAINVAISSIENHKRQLLRFIKSHPRFLYSFEPVEVDEGPAIARLMADAAKKAEVGPMAAVAGVLAELAVENMVLKGAEVAIVENGGEVSAFSKRPIDVALLAGRSFPSKRLGFRLDHFPIGIATSSGIYSHAFSFGDAEAVTIFASNSGLADAAATSVCNIISGNDPQKAIDKGIRRALSISGVKGVFILYKSLIGRSGQIPKIIKILPEKE